MAGSFALLVVEFIFMAALVVYLVRYYKSPVVGRDTEAATLLAWGLGFAGILLLPYDIAVALVHGGHESSLRGLWDTIYWSTFWLAWIILPLQLTYHMSGEFTIKDKCIDSLKQNAISYAAGFIFFVIFVIYMLSTNGGSTEALMGFMMAMTNTYGLMIVIVLMGNGLVSIPRRLWEMGSTPNELVRLYMLASSVDNDFHDARFDLEDCELEAKRLRKLAEDPKTDPELRGYFDLIQQKIDSFDFKGKSSSHQFSQRPDGGSSATKTLPTDAAGLRKALVGLNWRLNAAQRRIMASSRRWTTLLDTVKSLEDISAGTLRPEDSSWCQARSRSVEGEADGEGGQSGGLCGGILLDTRNRLRLFWRTKCYATFCRVSAIVCGLMSVLIMYSEITMATDSLESPVGELLVNMSDNGAGIFMVQMIGFCALSYMSVCTYWAMFRMNLGWMFTLQPDQQSPATSLLFNATYLCRLQFSLAFNFLLTINKEYRMRDTSFLGLMFNMEIVPLFGTDFQVYAPIIILVMGALTLLNIYARILKMLGVDSEDAITGGCVLRKKHLDSYDLELINMGKKLVAAQLKSADRVSGMRANGASPGGFGRDTAALLSDTSARSTSNTAAHDDSFGFGSGGGLSSKVIDVVSNPLMSGTSMKPVSGRAAVIGTSVSSSAPRLKSGGRSAQRDVEMGTPQLMRPSGRDSGPSSSSSPSARVYIAADAGKVTNHLWGDDEEDGNWTPSSEPRKSSKSSW